MRMIPGRWQSSRRACILAVFGTAFVIVMNAGCGINDDVAPEPGPVQPTSSMNNKTSEEPTPSLWIVLPDGYALNESGGGFDDDGLPWATYLSADGRISASVRCVTRHTDVPDAATMKRHAIGAVTAVHDETWTVREDPQSSAAYSYPVSAFEFTSGTNDDTRRTLGLYIQTDSGHFVVEGSTSGHESDLMLRTIDDFLKHLEFVDGYPS